MKKVKGSFLFIIKSDDGKEHKWLVDLKTGSGTLKRGAGGGCPSYMRTTSTYKCFGTTYRQVYIHDSTLL